MAHVNKLTSDLSLRPSMSARTLAIAMSVAVLLSSCDFPRSTVEAESASTSQQKDSSVGPAGLKIGEELAVIDGAFFNKQPRLVSCVSVTLTEGGAAEVDTSYSDISTTDIRSRAANMLVWPSEDGLDGIYDSSCSRLIHQDGTSVGLSPPDATRINDQYFDGNDIFLRRFGAAVPLTLYVGAQGHAVLLPAALKVGGRDVTGDIAISAQKIAAVDLFFGGIKKDLIVELRDSLSARYEMISPSASELEDFEAGRRSCVSFASRDRSVALELRIEQYGLATIHVLYAAPEDQQTFSFLRTACLPAEVIGKVAASDL